MHKLVRKEIMKGKKGDFFKQNLKDICIKLFYIILGISLPLNDLKNSSVIHRQIFNTYWQIFFFVLNIFEKCFFGRVFLVLRFLLN